MQKVVGVWNGGKKVSSTLGNGLKIDVTEDGPFSTDLVLAGLTSCATRTLTLIFSKMRVEVDSVELEVLAERQKKEPPAIFEKITMIYHVELEEEQTAKIGKAVRLVDNYCTVYNILKSSTDIEVKCVVNGTKLF